MTTDEITYRAGCIFSEIDHHFGGKLGLSSQAYEQCSRHPLGMPVYLRHVWQKALKNPDILALLDGFTPEDKHYDEIERCCFAVGYWHQKTARQLGKTFPEKLKALMGSITPTELAEGIGSTRQGIHKLLNGESKPTWDTVQKIAAFLNVQTDVFRTE